MKKYEFFYSVLWNITLITVGALLFAVGTKAIAENQHFVTGGIFGTSLLLYYVTGLLSPNIFYLLINIPLFVVGWIYVSRRFLYYSLYAMLVIALTYGLVDFEIGIRNQIYAAITAGVICGAGTGTILRSIGSAGGLDIIAIVLNKYFNIGIGKFYFAFNGILFVFTLLYLNLDLAIASLILVFISSSTIEYVLSLFTQRKLVYVISDKNDVIAERIMEVLRIGATLLKAKGAYSGRDRDVLMTVTSSIRLKRLEEIVFTTDPEALFIVERTLSVIGSNFSKRKIY